jgi:hypothetical protein
MKNGPGYHVNEAVFVLNEQGFTCARQGIPSIQGRKTKQQQVGSDRQKLW